MNVILVVLESAGAQYLGPYGAADDPMPALTTLATHALVFDAAYAAYPESVKGLYATLCGRMPVYGRPAEAHADLPCASAARSFASAGYRTALFHSGRFGYLGMDALVGAMGFETREDAGAIGGRVESSFGVDEGSTVERLLRWIDAGDRQTPFFAVYLPIAGHHPYAVSHPGPFPTVTDRDRYRNALHEADEALGYLLDGLRKRSLDRRTALLVVGDHGEAFGQHVGNAGHALFIYDENVHVPWILAVPGREASAGRVRTVTSLVDVPSTLRDLAGLAVDARDEGLGLRRDHRLALFFTDYASGRAGLRDGCWTYIYDADADRSRLFESCADAAQVHDRSAAEPARTRAYRERVRAAVLGRSDTMDGQR
jgi:arylsulfatase A-like enzyme